MARGRTTWAGLLLMALALPVAQAQMGVGSDGAVLHERVPATGGQSEIPVFVYDPREPSNLPEEIQIGADILPAPPLDAQPDPEDRPYDDRTGRAPGLVEGHELPPSFEPRGTLGNAARPDRDTQKEESLEYQASFDPSVVPFKRNRALNRVDDAGHLILVEGKRSPVPVIGHRVGPGREVFWGSVMVASRADEAIPLPTVAADSRLLAYETSPERELRFERDEADNLYVRAGGPGSFRLVYLIDADERYFSRPLPAGVTVDDIPAGLRPTLPEPLKKAGLEVAATLKLKSTMPFKKLIDGLVRHFRSFEPGEPPPETDDIYRDLALGKRGICRHRGYAFLITAHALGIPARYVFNEAHVFVEIWFPGNPGGWVRADLGGGANNLNISGGDSRVRHQPSGADPFSRPPAYREQMARDSAAGAEHITGMPRSRANLGSVPGTEDEGPVKAETNAPLRLETAMMLPEPMPRARPSRISLVVESPLVYRGDPIEVSGQVSGEDGGFARPGQKIQLVLRSLDGGATLGLVGVATTGRRGVWRATVMLPSQWPPGAYDLRAEYLGGHELAPSVSP